MKTLQTIGMSVWLIGIIVVWLIIARKKLLKFNGTRYRDRMIFSLVFAIILTVANLLMSPPSTVSMAYGILIGIIITVPSTLWERSWFSRRLDGAILRYKPNQYVRNLAWCIPISAGCIFLFRIMSSDLKSIILIALCVSWIGGSILAILRLIRIETILGEPIFEESGETNGSANK